MASRKKTGGPRAAPYTYWTWVVGLVAGDDHCWWKLWHKSRFDFVKRKDPEFDSARWNAAHASMVRREADRLRADGWEVYVENQNAFKIPGAATLLSGKPDIVAFRGDVILIVDVKGGQRRNAHWWQVAGYMQFIGHIVGDVLVAGKTVYGRLVYDDDDGPVDIMPEQLMPQTVIAALKTVAGPEPVPVPSEMECKYCDVAECPTRYVEKTVTATTPAGF